MKFTYVAFRNWGPYEKAKIEFTGRLVGILGPNGVGKSTIVEALYSATTGRFRKYPDLPSYVRDLPGGQKPASGWIEIGATVGSVEITVRRTVQITTIKGGGWKGSQKAKLTIKAIGATDGQEEVVEGANPVNQRLQELLGEDAQTLGDYAFVEQDAISAVVSADASTRTKMLHRLFGLDKYEKVWSCLGDEINAIPDLKAVDDIAALLTEQGSIRNTLSNLDIEVAALERDLEALGETQAQADIDAWDSMQAVREASLRIDEELKHARAQFLGAQASYEGALSHLTALQATTEQKRVASDAAHAALKLAEDARLAHKRIDDLRARATEIAAAMKATTRPPAVVELWTPNDEEELVQLQTQLQNSTRFIGEHAKFIAGGAVSPVCPTCGQSIADLAQELTKHQQQSAALTPVVQERAKRKRRLSDAYNAWVTGESLFKARMAELQESGKTVLDQIKSLAVSTANDGIYTDQYCADQRAIVNDYNQTMGSIAASTNVVAAYRAAEATAATALAEAEAKRNALQKQLTAVSPTAARLTPEHIDDCRRTLAAASNKRVQAIQLKERIRGLQMQDQSVQVRLSRAEAIQDQVKTLRTTKQMLADARDVFHRDNLPMKLANRYVHAIDTQLAKFLDLMQSSFTAHLLQTDGGYDFRCVFSDTSERMASHLSGGEKVRFSVAFLMAVYAVRSAGLGVLSLDEPTAQLDDEQIERLVAVLQRVRDYAASVDVQIFMITHSRQLDSVFDHVVRLPLGVTDDMED